MNMVPVVSSDISSIGFENGTLHIKFNSGGLYAYYGVPQSVHAALMSASSQGKFFHTFIKGKYGDTKIG